MSKFERDTDTKLNPLSSPDNHNLPPSQTPVLKRKDGGISSAKALKLKDWQFERFIDLLKFYAMFRNQAQDFDSLIGLMVSNMGDLSEQEKDLLLQIEYAYVSSFKPNSSLNVMMKVGNLIKEAEDLMKELKAFGLTRDPKQTSNYIKAIDSTTRLVKLANDVQEKLFSYVVVEGLISLILEHGDERIKVQVLDYLNKIRYGK